MTESQRKTALELVTAALAAVDPEAAVQRQLRLEGSELVAGSLRFPLHPDGRVLVVGAGKAAPAMARACEAVLGPALSGGLILAKAGQVRPPLPQRIEVCEAGHPLPDRAGVEGTARLLALLEGLQPRDLVLCLISGGGSSLLTLPAVGLELDELVELSQILLGAGVPIEEMNAVRKHLGRVTGGRLAARAAPARVLSLILSDVVGSPLAAIASGPTVPDPTSYADALAILERRSLSGRVPAPVLRVLREGAAGQREETPKPGDPRLAKVENLIVGDNELAARAAARRAEELGLHSLILSTFVEGEAREVGRVLAALLREVDAHGRPLGRPACLVAGGETTVTLCGAPGRGGRNQELALAAAFGLEGLRDVALVALASDGNDGPTDAGGALVDGTTLARCRTAGLDPTRHLLANDAYPLFATLGDLLLTGPTGTNVNDLYLLLAF